MEKPSLPKGTRDFGPAQMAKRQFIFDNIKKVFQTYGFQPLETPAMENLSTLTGKYGDEGDQLLFKILDSGEYQKNLVGSESFKDLYKTSFKERHFAETLLGVFHESESALERLSRLVFSSNSESRDPKAICRLIYSRDFEIHVMIGVLQPERNLLEEFIKKNDILIANSLIDFYIKANVYDVNYAEKHDKQFYQYIRNRFLPLFAGYLFDFLVQRNLEILEKIPSNKITPEISEKGLRYDLTVPFARYVVMNKGEITFPFKRYQIQPVWRADRPQKGRYREFYQCDADVVGTDSLICEAEIILMIKDVFKGLGIQEYSIKVNHRGILSGLAELANAKENESSLFVAIDKLDKIGEEKVREELASRGFDQNSLNIVFEILNFSGSTQQKIDFLTEKFASSTVGQKGITDFKEVLNLLANYGTTEDHVEFDISLARGLSYYTGCIFEVKISNVAIGSVSGGGRYDNLTSMFDDKERLSGVGFSFGVDRLYDAMTELEAKEKRNLFPEGSLISSKALICHTNNSGMLKGLAVLNKLREAGIASEIYPDEAKAKKPLEKPLQYATKKSIPYAIVVDWENTLLIFKNLKTGEQENISVDAIIERLKYQS